VFLANHIKLHSKRAIKRISKHHFLHNELLREAHILKQLKHSLLPLIYDFEEDNDYSYIIEEYIEGTLLSEYMDKDQNLSFSEILSIGIQVCDLIQYLNSNTPPILYLDLKPENIIIKEDLVYLIDFGAASFRSQVKEREYSLGTKGYASPELLTGKDLDERADVYGIGALLYYLVTGKAYEGKMEKGIRFHSKSYKGLYVIIKCSLSIHPSLRYKNATILRKRLILLRKNCDKTDRDNRATIAVAGSDRRVGVTHLALLLTACLGRKAVYREENLGNHIPAILNYHHGRKVSEQIYRVGSCNLLVYDIEEITGYIQVIDYGVLTKENVGEFLKEDKKILVLGAKEWELLQSEIVLKLLEGQKDIAYAFSFLDGSQFYSVLKNMKGYPCFRIPYEPNLFQRKIKAEMKDFLTGILEVEKSRQ